jgi:hypothetical protein
MLPFVGRLREQHGQKDERQAEQEVVQNPAGHNGEQPERVEESSRGEVITAVAQVLNGDGLVGSVEGLQREFLRVGAVLGLVEQRTDAAADEAAAGHGGKVVNFAEQVGLHEGLERSETQGGGADATTRERQPHQAVGDVGFRAAPRGRGIRRVLRRKPGRDLQSLPAPACSDFASLGREHLL